MTQPVLAPEPADEIREQMARFQENTRFAEMHWDEFYRDHPGEWAVVYDDHMVRFAADPRELMQGVPEQHRPSAVILYLQRVTNTLIL